MRELRADERDRRVLSGGLDSASCGSGALSETSPALRNAAAQGAHGPALRASPPATPRWSAAHVRTISVRIDSARDLAAWNPSYRTDVVDALSAWEAAGSPVRFVLVSRGSDADITVRWVARFAERYEGWTTVSWDHSGWLTRADVSLALENPAGELLTPAARARVAMHELGHALGLSHSSDDMSIMAPTVRTYSIGPDDIRILRDLYVDQRGTDAGLVATRQDARGGSQCAAPAG